MIDVEKLISAANEIPPLPQTVTRLLELLEDAKTNVEEIEEILAHDGALAAHLLRQANSASSASRQPIGTIPAAVVRLGFGGVLALTVAISTQRYLDGAVPAYGLKEGTLWKHAQAARLAIEGLRKFAKLSAPPEAQTAALLHDIGKAVLANHLDPQVLEVMSQAAGDGNVIDSRVEKEILEIDHGELGGLIAQHWKLPDLVVRGIMYHHTPELCSEADNRICHVVCVANWIAHAATAKRDGEPFHSTPPPSAATLGLKAQEIDAAIDYVAEGLAAFEAM